MADGGKKEETEEGDQGRGSGSARIWAGGFVCDAGLAWLYPQPGSYTNRTRDAG